MPMIEQKQSKNDVRYHCLSNTKTNRRDLTAAPCRSIMAIVGPPNPSFQSTPTFGWLLCFLGKQRSCETNVGMTEVADDEGGGDFCRRRWRINLRWRKRSGKRGVMSPSKGHVVSTTALYPRAFLKMREVDRIMTS